MLYRAHIFSVSSLSISLSLVRRNFQRLTYSVWILNIPTWAIIPRNYSSQGFFLYIPPFSNSLCHRSLHMIGSIHFDNGGDQWSPPRYSIRSEILKKIDFKFLDPWKIKPTTFLPFSESSITTSISNFNLILVELKISGDLLNLHVLLFYVMFFCWEWNQFQVCMPLCHKKHKRRKVISCPVEYVTAAQKQLHHVPFLIQWISLIHTCIYT